MSKAGLRATYANAIRDQTRIFFRGEGRATVSMKKKRRTKSERSVFTFVFSGHPEGSRGSEPRATISEDPRARRRERKNKRERERESALGYPGGLDRTRNTKGANYNDNAPSSARPPPGLGKKFATSVSSTAR